MKGDNTMKNYENIVSMNQEELADFLCTFMNNACADNDLHPCDICPARETCRRGHNGFKDWLNEEVI